MAAHTKHSTLQHSRLLLQSLETAASRTDTLHKNQTLRKGILSALVPSAQALLESLQADGSIGEFELDSSCITWLGKLPPSQQNQVGLTLNVPNLRAHKVSENYFQAQVSQHRALRQCPCLCPEPFDGAYSSIAKPYNNAGTWLFCSQWHSWTWPVRLSPQALAGHQGKKAILRGEPHPCAQHCTHCMHPRSLIRFRCSEAGQQP